MTSRNFIEFVTHSQQNSPAKRRHLEALWQAAYRAGQLDMRERAEDVCWNHPAEFGFKPKVAAAIRALPIKDQP